MCIHIYIYMCIYIYIYTYIYVYTYLGKEASTTLEPYRAQRPGQGNSTAARYKTSIPGGDC